MAYRIKQLGMSLIELMVAMAIGLVVMLVVFQLFSVSEGTRRTSVAGSDAQMSAAIAVTALQDQLRNAGYGLADRFQDLGASFHTAFGCAVNGVDVRGGTAVPVTYSVTPVVITQGPNNDGTGVGTDSDTITVMYSDLPYPTVPTRLQQNMLGPTDNAILVNNRYGIRPGDVLVLAQNVAGVMTCRMIEATGTPTVPPADPNAQVLNSTVLRGTGTYLDSAGNTVKVRFNDASGTTPTTYTTDGAIYNFGRGPSRVQFQLADSTVPPDGIADQLAMTNFLGAGTGAPTAQPLVEGIVALQAQYGVGVDTTAPVDGFADQFDPGAGLGAWQVGPVGTNCPPLADGGGGTCRWGLVVAVRFAVLARSNLIERKDPATNQCIATPANSPELTWAGGTFNLSHIPDWQCYRYKKFEAVVPLRNLIWMPATS
jgi:type IV pilus assembly protein PilW